MRSSRCRQLGISLVRRDPGTFESAVAMHFAQRDSIELSLPLESKRICLRSVSEKPYGVWISFEKRASAQKLNVTHKSLVRMATCDSSRLMRPALMRRSRFLTALLSPRTFRVCAKNTSDLLGCCDALLVKNVAAARSRTGTVASRQPCYPVNTHY